MPCPFIGDSAGGLVAEATGKPIVITRHAWRRDPAKGIAAASGRRKPVERAPEWRSRRWAARNSMQVAAVVAHEPDQLVVVTVYTYFFTQPELPP